MSDKLYTMEEAKQLLKDNWEKGIDCPCCTQFVKLYKRPLYSAQAYSLIRLYKLCQDDYTYHHISKISQENASRGGDFENVVSECIDTMVGHLIYVAKEENVPTTETDMLKIVEVITRMKIEGVE